MKSFTKSNLTNSILDFINTLCNFIALNLVFLITCLPVITIGASLVSLYQVMLKEARGEYDYLVRTYLKELKNNLKKGTFTFLFFFSSGLVLLFNLSFWSAFDHLISVFIMSVFIIVSIIYVITFLYTFPILAQFENNIIQTLKNAFFISLVHKKITFLLLLMDAFVLCLCVFFPPMKLFMVLFGFAFLTYCKSFLFIKVFDCYKETTMVKDGAYDKFK